MQQPPLLRRRDVGETRLAFGKPIDPEVLSNLDARLDRFVSHTVPEDYLPVRAYVKARSVEEAYEVGQNAIDFVRGLWNLCWNMGGQGFRISSGRAAPVNKILLGPTRTVHNADGELAEENFWYNPGYYGPMPLANRLTEKWDAIQKFERKARRAIKRSASSTLLTRLVVRYVRSLDEEILETSFLKLWTPTRDFDWHSPRRFLSSVNYPSRSATTRIPVTYLLIFLRYIAAKWQCPLPWPRRRERTIEKDAKHPCPLPEAGPRSGRRRPWFL